MGNDLGVTDDELRAHDMLKQRVLNQLRLQAALGALPAGDSDRPALENLEKRICPMGFRDATLYQSFISDVTLAAKASHGVEQVVLTGTASVYYSANPKKGPYHHFDANGKSDLDIVIAGEAVPRFMESHGYQKDSGKALALLPESSKSGYRDLKDIPLASTAPKRPGDFMPIDPFKRKTKDKVFTTGEQATWIHRDKTPGHETKVEQVASDIVGINFIEGETADIYGATRTHAVYREFKEVSDKWKELLGRPVEFSAYTKATRYPVKPTDFVLYG